MSSGLVVRRPGSGPSIRPLPWTQEGSPTPLGLGSPVRHGQWTSKRLELVRCSSYPRGWPTPLNIQKAISMFTRVELYDLSPSQTQSHLNLTALPRGWMITFLFQMVNRRSIAVGRDFASGHLIF